MRSFCHWHPRHTNLDVCHWISETVSIPRRMFWKVFSHTPATRSLFRWRTPRPWGRPLPSPPLLLREVSYPNGHAWRDTHMASAWRQTSMVDTFPTLQLRTLHTIQYRSVIYRRRSEVFCSLARPTTTETLKLSDRTVDRRCKGLRIVALRNKLCVRWVLPTSFRPFKSFEPFVLSSAKINCSDVSCGTAWSRRTILETSSGQTWRCVVRHSMEQAHSARDI